MKKIFIRINGLLHLAEKRARHDNAIDKIVARQVIRNLKMVKKIIAEEIVQCGQCRDFASPQDSVECGYICSGVAELLESRGEGYCTYKNRNDIVPLNGYCHRGERACKR